MNLWFRLIVLVFAAWRATPFRNTDGVSRVRARVWPHDLDLSLHVNNGRYLTLMDLGRSDWIIRSGLLRLLWRHKWTPVVTTITARFVREMRFWTRFRIETRIIGWQDTQVFFEHRIIFESGKRSGDIAALALAKTGIYDRAARRMIPIDELFRETGLSGEHLPLRSDAEALLVLEASMNAIGKRKV